MLDTNIVIDVMKHKVEVANKVDLLEEYCISSVVLGELFTGVYRVLDRQKHLDKLNNFLKNCNVLNVDSVTAKIYGELYAALLNKGKPIPINDVWIAASAKQHDLTLITKDKHFAEIEGLDV